MMVMVVVTRAGRGGRNGEERQDHHTKEESKRVHSEYDSGKRVVVTTFFIFYQRPYFLIRISLRVGYKIKIPKVS
jgi:hypothetical protein